MLIIPTANASWVSKKIHQVVHDGNTVAHDAKKAVDDAKTTLHDVTHS